MNYIQVFVQNYPNEIHPDYQLMPERKSDHAAGWDIKYSGNEGILTLMPGQRKAISTGLRLAIPSHMFARCEARSGLALNYGIQVLAGVIDADYRGEIMVILYNSGDIPLTIKPYERIAQLVFHTIHPENIGMELVHDQEDLGETRRGTAGFGSTGAN